MSRARDTAGIIQYNRISIDSNNAVGIGSSIPDCKLDIDGGLRVVGVSTFEGKTEFTTDNVVLTTTNQLRLGSGENTFFYVGSDSDTYLQTNNNELLIGGPTVKLQSYGSVGSAGENYLIATQNGAVELYYDNSKKLETTGGGITVTGITTCDGISMGDDEKALFGTGDDLEIYHDGTNSVIDNNTGDLNITTTGSGDDIYLDAADDIYLRVAGTESGVSIIGDGAVTLYYDNSSKFVTTGGGVSVTGVCTATSFAGSGANLTDLNIPASFNDLDAALFS